MIQHVYERVCESRIIERVIVATDDERISDVVRGFGGEAVITSLSHSTGSERVAEVVQSIDCKFVVNIQGDEPLIKPEIIDEITLALVTGNDIEMSTGAHQIFDEEMFHDPNSVKVVTDNKGFALYFSRSLIPYPRDSKTLEVFEHIGIYAFRKEFLLKFVQFEDTPLSLTESLEQLKVLENGFKIKVVEIKHDYKAVSVDTEDDLNEVRRIVKAQSNS